MLYSYIEWTFVNIEPYAIEMKNKIHLIYGIVIGILLCACVGSYEKDEKDEEKFETEKVTWTTLSEANSKLKELKEEGWTIIEIDHFPTTQGSSWTIFHVGK